MAGRILAREGRQAIHGGVMVLGRGVGGTRLKAVPRGTNNSSF